jgi:hypothetical protein
LDDSGESCGFGLGFDPVAEMFQSSPVWTGHLITDSLLQTTAIRRQAAACSRSRIERARKDIFTIDSCSTRPGLEVQIEFFLVIRVMNNKDSV